MAPEVRRHDQRPLPAPLDLQLARDLGRPTGVLWTVAFSGQQDRRVQSCSAAVTSPPPTVQMPARRRRLTRFQSRDPETQSCGHNSRRSPSISIQ
jgi:hypothetical protein